MSLMRCYIIFTRSLGFVLSPQGMLVYTHTINTGKYTQTRLGFILEQIVSNLLSIHFFFFTQWKISQNQHLKPSTKNGFMECMNLQRLEKFMPMAYSRTIKYSLELIKHKWKQYIFIVIYISFYKSQNIFLESKIFIFFVSRIIT